MRGGPDAIETATLAYRLPSDVIAPRSSNKKNGKRGQVWVNTDKQFVSVKTKLYSVTRRSRAKRLDLGTSVSESGRPEVTRYDSKSKQPAGVPFISARRAPAAVSGVPVAVATPADDLCPPPLEDSAMWRRRCLSNRDIGLRLLSPQLHLRGNRMDFPRNARDCLVRLRKCNNYCRVCLSTATCYSMTSTSVSFDSNLEVSFGFDPGLTFGSGSNSARGFSFDIDL
ncbi:hypothetical protein EVAR_38844_1 [Eumeta japonica]|uniref:Uncharacterized protein n=1 Tax=Eumeta variegata TaxID=151549 RepID=A0A4C1XTG8_EUMVA|nr:hypothetical protein EVAR_38844_1 [Eumeta japonica]